MKSLSAPSIFEKTLEASIFYTLESQPIRMKSKNSAIDGQNYLITNAAIFLKAGIWPGKNIDIPLIYGDYFFVEGLARL